MYLKKKKITYIHVCTFACAYTMKLYFSKREVFSGRIISSTSLSDKGVLGMRYNPVHI